ncbi:MAG: sodium/proton antiporter, partial [Serratia sp.]|nr:sodium/proton antiporter [Serratia sp. (in: enterobacteria)]
METTFTRAFVKNFLGQSPNWYKITILAFLVINPLVFFLVSPFLAGWMLVVEFIFTLGMALKCYPLQPGGLLAIEAVITGMTSAERIREEISANLEVILLLIFMVAGIYFMKQLLLYVFTKLLLNLRNKIALSLAFCFAAAFLSAFLDALTVIAVVISVSVGFYSIYHKVASNQSESTDVNDDSAFTGNQQHQAILEQFRAFLRSLMMHAGV